MLTRYKQHEIKGYKNRASEILNKKIKLSLDMVKKSSDKLQLIQAYLEK